MIGIIGGTCPQGRGLARRFAESGLSVIVGSRDAERAKQAATELGSGMQGLPNAECADRADTVVIAVPWDGHREQIQELARQLDGKIVVDCVNPLGFDKQGPFGLEVEEGSAAQQAQALLPDSVLTAAFHHPSAVSLLDGEVTDPVKLCKALVGTVRRPSSACRSGEARRLLGVRGSSGWGLVPELRLGLTLLVQARRVPLPWTSLGSHEPRRSDTVFQARRACSQAALRGIPMAKRMTTTDALVRGRQAVGKHAWGDAFAELSAADLDLSLEPGDLERLAVTACLVGKDGEAVDVWARAHREWMARGDPARAARCAFWPALWLLITGEVAPSTGWLARARQVLEDLDCVEQGYLLVPRALLTMYRGDAEAAYAAFAEASEIGDRFHERDLMTIGRLGRAQARIRLGDTTEGTALLDEAMVAVTAGEVSPIVSGIVYCAVLLECTSILDMRRAREWTAALDRWSAAQPDLVPFRGECLVHRVEVMQWYGDWPVALAEAHRARARLSDPPRPALGMACYQLGELHRLRGEFAAAEEAYREANRRGRMPQPGLALLRLSQGQVEQALAAIRPVLEEARDHPTRSQLLGAYVEIALAAGDLDTARGAADQLEEVAAQLAVPCLRARAAHATGAVMLAEGDADAAVAALRRASTVWKELEAPYELARTRVLLGFACRKLGDEEGAAMEFDAARWAFRRLQAAPDLVRLETFSQMETTESHYGLTARELEVLALVAVGKTNREIATTLFLSDHTVRRHLQNVFAKLGVSSRAAATAYAIQHDLI